MKRNSKLFSNNNKQHLRGGEFIAGSSRKFPTDTVELSPLEVKVFNNFDRAFKAFRALVQKEKILSLYKEKQSYEKPSDKKRRKRNEAKRKIFELEMKKNSFEERKVLRKRDEEELD